jgi:hypothetical protein
VSSSIKVQDRDPIAATNFVQLGFSSKSGMANRSWSGSLSFRMADKKASGSVNEVDMFKSNHN